MSGYDWIEKPKRGQVYASVHGQQRLVMDVIGDNIFYRSIGKTVTNRKTHIKCWREWCEANYAFIFKKALTR